MDTDNKETFNSVQWLNISGRDTLYQNGFLPDMGYVSNDSVMNIPAFYAGVRLLAARLAPLPKELKQYSKGNVKEIDEHPLLVVLNRKINDYASPTTTFETLWYHAFVYGNGYLYINRNGKRIQLVNLNPQNVRPIRVDGVKYFYLQSEARVLTNDEVIHIVGLSYDGICGMNPIEMLADTFERMQTIQSFQVKYFRNGTQVSGTIEVPAAMTKEQIDTMKASIGDNLSGAMNAGKIPILPFGAKLVSNSANNEQSQLAELAKISVADSERILGLPPGILSQPHNLNENSIRIALKSHLTKLEEELDKLLSLAEFNKGYYFKINTSSNAIEITDINGALLAVNAGLLSPNEARDMLDKAPYEGGDKFRIPVAISQPQPVSDNNNPQTQPTGATGAGDANGDSEQPTGANAAADGSEPLKASAAIAVAPLVTAAVERVQRKELKAFGNHKNKWDEKYLAWKHNRFCNEQSEYLRDALKPVAEAFKNVSGKEVDLEPLVEEYKNAIYSLNAGEEFSFDLQEKVSGVFK